LIKEFFPQLNSMAHVLGIPHNILIIPGILDSVFLRNAAGGPYHSTMIALMEEMLLPLPKDVDEPQDMVSFSSRFKRMLTSAPSQLMFSYLIDKFSTDLVAKEYKHLIGLEPLNDLVISTSVEGVLD